MKKITLLFCAALTLTCCTPRQETPEEQTVNEMETTTAPNAQESIQQILDEVMEAYNTLPAEKISSEAFDQKFMSKQYLQLDSIIQHIDSKFPGEIGFREYDHWVQGQDWEDLSYSIDSVKQTSATEAHVWINLHNFKDMPMEIKLVKENDTWKIEDLIANGQSEVEMMREYIHANQGV